MVPEYFKLPWTWTSDQGGLGDCLVNFTGVGVRWEFRASAVQASGSHGVVLERSGGYRRRTYAQTLPLPRSMQKFSICGINPKLIVDMPTGVLVSLGE